MGYELHIKRRVDWEDDEEDSNISLEEWLSYVQSDEELELTEGYRINVPGVVGASQNVPGFCNWTGHPTKKTKDDKPWFDYGYGEISTKYPDDETIRKMMMIAEKLNAKVQGDDNEFYDEDYFKNKENNIASDTPKQTPQQTPKQADKKSWWKFW
jgi:hypothetical protein